MRGQSQSPVGILASISTRPYFISILPRVVSEALRTGGIVMDELVAEEMMQSASVEIVQYWPRSRYVVLEMLGRGKRADEVSRRPEAEAGESGGETHPDWRSVASDVRDGTMLSAPSAT